MADKIRTAVTDPFWWNLIRGLAVGLLIAWLVLVAAVASIRPQGGLLREALQLLPDLLRLQRRLAADPALPRDVRIRLGLLMAYLALPIDLIPDFVPVIGSANDTIIVTAVLHSVVRRAGLDVVRTLAWHRRRLHRPHPAHRADQSRLNPSRVCAPCHRVLRLAAVPVHRGATSSDPRPEPVEASHLLEWAGAHQKA